MRRSYAFGEGELTRDAVNPSNEHQFLRGSMPSRRYEAGSIRQFILSAGPFRTSLSASEQERTRIIWAQLSSDSESQAVTVPEALVGNFGRLTSSSLKKEPWTEKFEKSWRRHKMSTGSSITLTEFVKAAHTCIYEPARAKGTLTQDPNVSRTLPVGKRQKKDIFGSRGITNLGQTCYLGATVQFATGCVPFCEAVEQTPFLNQTTHVKKKDASKLMLAKELRTAIIQIGNTKADGPFHPEKLERCLLTVKKNDWDDNDQQDAHEAWMTLKGAVHESTNKAKGEVESFQYPSNEDIARSADSSWKSILEFQSNSCGDRPFLGQYVMERWCTRCQKSKPVTFGTFTTLELKMPDNTRQTAIDANKPLTIMDLLHENYATEPLEVQCETCDEITSFSQDHSITHLPDYLVFMVGRFVKGPAGAKLKDRVHFEVDGLDVHDFVHPKKRTLEHPKYDCTAVLHHRGDTMKAGHYVTYLREQTLDGLVFTSRHAWFLNSFKYVVL